MDRLCTFRIIFTCLFFCLQLSLVQQWTMASGPGRIPVADNMSDTVIIIRKISITGNKITRREIILRELEFREQDTVSEAHLSSVLISGKQNVFNTRLFNFVTIDTTYGSDHHFVDIHISVVERWYIWPIPFFQISDRNFNVWWETRDINRLTYGVDLTFSNARGRNETLKIMAHFGYNQKFGFTYKIPYINSRQTLGTGFGAAVELSHELPVSTIDNKPVYLLNSTSYLKKMISSYADLSFRPDFFTTHTCRIAYSRYNFDSILMTIPGFVLTQQGVQQFFSLSYLFRLDHRDVQYYPLTGYFMDAELNHSVPYETAANSYFKTSLKIYRQLYNRWYWASGFTGKISFEKIQPYYLERGFGYGRDYVRGYEYYVVDGQHFALLKSNLKYALLPNCVGKLNFIQSGKFNTIPLALYINAFVDMGFVYNYSADSDTFNSAGNTLENSFLIGYGIGVDFATYYDFVIRVEASLNRMNQPGIYLHFISPI